MPHERDIFFFHNGHEGNQRIRLISTVLCAQDT